MELILFALAFIGLAMLGMAIRILLVKGGTFRGSCSSQNVTGDDSCSICGREDMSECPDNEDESTS